jgi:hypothetical protein
MNTDLKPMSILRESEFPTQARTRNNGTGAGHRTGAAAHAPGGGPASKRQALSYLFVPVVVVSAGVCVAPAFGITVSFMVVDGIFGL